MEENPPVAVQGHAARSATRRATLTRATIVEAARELVRDQGLRALSLRRVAATLGVTAPALYAHVQGKEDLLAAVAEEEFGLLTARFAQISDPDPVERLRGYCKAYVAHALESPSLFEVMFLFQPRLAEAPAHGNPQDPATRAFRGGAEAVEAAAAAGRLRLEDPMLATFVTWSAAHGLAEVLLMGFDLGQEFTEQLVEATIESVIRGITI